MTIKLNLDALKTTLQGGTSAPFPVKANQESEQQPAAPSAESSPVHQEDHPEPKIIKTVGDFKIVDLGTPNKEKIAQEAQLVSIDLTASPSSNDPSEEPLFDAIQTEPENQENLNNEPIVFLDEGVVTTTDNLIQSVENENMETSEERVETPLQAESIVENSQTEQKIVMPEQMEEEKIEDLSIPEIFKPEPERIFQNLSRQSNASWDTLEHEYQEYKNLKKKRQVRYAFSAVMFLLVVGAGIYTTPFISKYMHESTVKVSLTNENGNSEHASAPIDNSFISGKRFQDQVSIQFSLDTANGELLKTVESKTSLTKKEALEILVKVTNTKVRVPRNGTWDEAFNKLMLEKGLVQNLNDLQNFVEEKDMNIFLNSF